MPYVAATLRASPSKSTGYSVNYLMFGREVNTPADIVYGVVEPQAETSYDDFVESVRDRMQEAYNAVRKNLHIAANRNKRHYDVQVKQKLFQVGEPLYYFNLRRFYGRPEKWAKKYTGPFVVEKVLSPVNYLLKRSPCSKPFVSHVDKLRKFFETESEPVPPSAAPKPAVSPLPPSPGREDLQSLLGACDDLYESDEKGWPDQKGKTVLLNVSFNSTSFFLLFLLGLCGFSLSCCCFS